jgi:hypothetical protein
LNNSTIKNAYPLSSISEIMDKLREPNILQSWTSDGDIKMSISRRKMNGKQPSKPIEDFSN